MVAWTELTRGCDVHRWRQIDGPARQAWTLPYIVTVNDETPFGMYVSFPRFFEGQRESDDRLKWYATTTTKDIIMSAKVSALRIGRARFSSGLE